MDEDIWVGIDLGTQSVRVLAVTGTGQVRGSAARSLDSRRDGQRHEQDPRQWWEALCGAGHEALAEVPDAVVRGVAVDATSGTVLVVDADGRPLTPALMYDDTRATAETERVNEVGATTWVELGYQRMQPAWALPKLLWLLDHARPDGGLPPNARLAHQSDYVNRSLVGGPVATDLSNALKTGVHLVHEDWPREVFDRLDVPAELLPPVVLPGVRLGEISAEAAHQAGIPAGTPVYAGTTDGCASQLGAGATGVGSWNSILGTTLVLKGVTPNLVQDPYGVVYSHRSPDGGWLPGGASSTGAGAVAAQLPDRDLDALAAAAQRYERTDVLAYPLASGKGERFPFVAPDAVGFTLGTPRDDAEHYAALIQGVAFVERLCFDYLDLLGAPVDGDLVFTGGATRSRYWSQLRADLLRRPVRLPDNASSALGMAVLAAGAHDGSLGNENDGHGDQGGIAAAGRMMVRTRETLEPRPANGDHLAEGYRRLVEELQGRGWLPAEPAAHARAAAGGDRR